MALRTPGLAVEIAVANMDLYPYDLPGRPTWASNLEQLVPYLEETGARNFEIHPTHTLVQDIETRRQTGDTELVDTVVGSMHETFNEGEGLFGKIADRRGVQRSIASAVGMRAIQRALKRPVVAVRYPGADGIDPDCSESFQVVQPCAEVYRDHGTDLTNIKGVDGECPDTAHFRRKAADGTPPPSRTTLWASRFAAGKVYEMHVAADRTDMAKRDPDLAALSHAEFNAFTSRAWHDAWNTELGSMIVGAIENWVPPDKLSRATGAPVLRQVIELTPRPQAMLRRTVHHARFVENLAQIVREAGATPLLWGSVVTS